MPVSLISPAGFGRRTRAALAGARRLAARRRAAHVGTEHILLAVLDERESLAAVVLDALGVERDAVRRAVQHPGALTAPESQTWARLSLLGPKYTARARRALELATAEALEFGHPAVNTEHVLLGLLRDAGSAAGRALATSGADYAGARRETLRLLGRPASP